jgi:tRNA threonylcarbamoyladenosine modification (KEOPS) complex  Pcc1 subunit
MIAVTVEIETDSIFESRVIHRALKPELSSNISKGINIEQHNQKLRLLFESRDTASMRAAVNSVLRWIMTSLAICKLIRRD